FGLHLVANLLITLALQFIIRLFAVADLGFTGIFIGFRPVNHAHGVIRFRVVRVRVDRLFIVGAGLIKLFLLHVEVGNAFEAGYVGRLFGKYILVLLNGQLGVANIVR